MIKGLYNMNTVIIVCKYVSIDVCTYYNYVNGCCVRTRLSSHDNNNNYYHMYIYTVCVCI